MQASISLSDAEAPSSSRLANNSVVSYTHFPRRCSTFVSHSALHSLAENQPFIEKATTNCCSCPIL